MVGPNDSGQQDVGADEGRSFKPDTGQLADLAYLAWDAQGVVTPGDIHEMAIEDDIDINPYEIRNGMDYLLEEGLVGGEGFSYDVGRSQQFGDPEPELVDRLLSPVFGESFIEDGYTAFSLVYEAQKSYESGSRIDKTVEEDGGGPAYMWPWTEELDEIDELDSGDQEYTTSI